MTIRNLSQGIKDYFYGGIPVVFMQELLDRLQRKPGSHKGENGRVGIIGGSIDYTGAPALSAEAALRSGCDLVKILTSEDSRDVVASYSENLIVGSYPSPYFDESGLDRAEELREWADALVIGPGLGEADEKAVRDFVSSTEKPVVIDADAIRPALDAELSRAVFTPHLGEAQMMEDRAGEPLEAFVENRGSIVVQKGSIDQIFTSSRKYENSTGTSDMTVGGTGDTLTGVIASLVSQGLNPVEAARLGAWVNGKAGELAADRYGHGMTATDLVEKIPEAKK